METQTKICRKCKCEKSLDEFYKNNNNKDGHHIWCKDCGKKYRQKNIEKELIRVKAYNIANKEKIAAKNKAYNIANKEKIVGKAKVSYADNKEKILAMIHNYRANNKEKIKLLEKNRKKQLTENVNDIYVICCVARQTKLTTDEIKKFVPQLIDLKREELLLKRQLKNK